MTADMETTRDRGRTGAIADLDAWLSSDDVFRAPREEQIDRRLEAIRTAFTRHQRDNAAFQAFAERQGFEACNLTDETLDKVPLLPAGLFKRHPEGVRTGSSAVVETTSSGTLGTISRVPRDDTTMMRFFASLAAATKELLDVEHAETVVRNVGPRVDDSEHLWIAYVMAGVSVLHETEFFVRGGTLHREELLETLRSDDPGVPSVLIGPPPLLWDLAQDLIDDPLVTNDRRYLITMGGWKRRAGDMVAPEEFDPLMVRALGLSDGSRVRDAFNMVELNTAVLECSERRKHCPPWIHVSARDALTLEQVDGRPGVLAYVDPTPTSFPGAVLSEDFGWVDREVACACGITGDVLRIERRINKLESRGCAMKI